MRIDFIDGLRGFFALGVLYAHYSSVFFMILPSGFYHFASIVCGFFVISGFILSYRFWQNRETKSLTSMALRRYFRLTPLPLVSLMFVFILMKFNLFLTNESCTIVPIFEVIKNYYGGDWNLLSAFKGALWDMYFDFKTIENYNVALWTMEYELKGSLMSLACLALLGNVKRRILIYLIFLILTFDSLYLNFVFGIMLSDLIYSDEGKKYFEILKSKQILSWIIFAVGCFLSYYALDINLYGKLNFEIFSAFEIDVERLYHIIGIAMFIYGIIHLKILQNFFGSRFFTILGKYSFAIYILHVPMGLFFNGYCFINLYELGFSPVTSANLSIVAGFLSTLAGATIIYHFVEMPSIKLTKRIEKIFY